MAEPSFRSFVGEYYLVVDNGLRSLFRIKVLAVYAGIWVVPRRVITLRPFLGVVFFFICSNDKSTIWQRNNNKIMAKYNEEDYNERTTSKN